MNQETDRVILEQYKEVIDVSSIVSKTDIKGKITYVNALFCEISGYSKSELIGESHNIVRHEDMSKEIFSSMWQTILAKKVWKGVLKNRAKDSSVYYVKTTVVPILDEDDNILEFMAFREDITERILLEKKVKLEHERTQQLLNSQESMIIISDDTVGVLEANQKFFDVTGYKNIEDFHQEYRCICELFIEREGYLRVSSEEFYWAEPIIEFPNKLHKALILDTNGNEIIFDVRGKNIELDNKKYVISTFSDITEVEMMRKTSEEAEKAKSIFLANMSHEIRTPMNGISGFLKLLEKTKLDDTQKKYLSITQSSVKSLLGIINDILDFSKLDSKNMQSETIELNPFSEFEKAFLMFSAKAHEKNINFQIHLDENMHESLFIDEMHIRQVMHNLINNAIKFTPEEGTIEVKVEKLSEIETHETLRFSVNDTGIGIAKDKQALVLEAFSQADESTTRKFGGTGLGLSISKSLVELMGSTLKLKSERYKGSCFYFDLTLKKAEVIESVAHHLQDRVVSLIESDKEIYKQIKTQLSNFHINYSVCSVDELITCSKNSQLIITCNEEYIAQLSSSVTTILISEESELIARDNLHIINSYVDCPSQLYNMLLHEEFIVSSVNEVESKKAIPLHILIAEDYEINRILLEEILSMYEGLSFSFVYDGQEAIDAIENMDEANAYDLILMDINMPVLDGIEATKILRQSGCTIPIVALTANALEGDRERFLAMGMDEYLSKPVDIDELERVLALYEKATLIQEEHSQSIDIAKVIDRTVEKTKLPKAVVLKLMQSYVQSFEGLLIMFKEGIVEKDYEKITRASHNIKSSSYTVGFEPIGDEAKRVEAKAIEKSEYSYQEALDRFELHYKQLLDL